MAFTNKFFSLAGQKERLKNVAGVLGQALNPFSKANPVANVKSKPVKKALEFVAANPYSTAALAVPVAKPATLGKAAVTKVLKVAAKKPAVTIISTGVGGGILATSQRARNVTGKAVSKLTPEALLGAGGSIGQAIDDPTVKNIKDALAKAALPAAVAGAGLALAAPALAGGAASLISQKQTRDEIKELSSALNSKNGLLTDSTAPAAGVVASSLPTAGQGLPVLESDKRKTTTTRRKRRTKKTQPIKISNRVTVNNRNINKVSFTKKRYGIRGRIRKSKRRSRRPCRFR
jgi:hypothetical protein